MISFVVILAALAVIALVGVYHRAPSVRGMSDNPGARAAIAALGGPLAVSSGDLRFETSLDPGSGAPPRPGGPGTHALASAESLLVAARKRRPSDPRLDCLLGHLDLARHRYENAERRYAAALGQASRYGEARLGLGVALALRAQTEGDLRRTRALNLRAIAQLAAVDEGDRFYLPALYDRVILLGRVGRSSEAVARARRYLEIEPRSVWAAALLRMMEGTRAGG